MGMFKKLTPLGRLVFIVLLVAILGFAGWKLTNNGQSIKKLSSGNPFAGNTSDATLFVDTYTGWAPIVWGNGGKEGSKDSYFYKNFGIRLDIKNADDFDASRKAWQNDPNALAFCTLDSYPVEAGENGGMSDARYFVIHNFSAGADAIVVTKHIKTVSDLKGKKIVCSEGTASHSLLLNTLEAAGLSNTDVEIVMTGYGSTVADAFKSGQVDAAVVFTPDDEACMKAVPGTHVLVSTKNANTLVTDGFLAHKEWLDKNPDKAKKFIEAILWANSEVTNNKERYNEACKVFSETFEVPLEDVLSTGEKINFATLQDNINWFGLNSSYTGVDASTLYSKMSYVYGQPIFGPNANTPLTHRPLPWTKIGYNKYVDELSQSNTLTNDQTANATKEKSFSAPSPEVQKADAVSTKKVIIEYPVNGFALDDNARATIDKEFLQIVKQFNNVYVRVEGNTDNTGNREYNVALSKKRAQSVVDYLVRQGMDANRFIVVGNGPSKAIADGVVGSNQSYRTTDLQLIGE